MFLPLNIIFISANSADPVDMPHIMWHFTWVFTVSQSTLLGASGPQRVKDPKRIGFQTQCQGKIERNSICKQKFKPFTPAPCVR